MRLRKLIVFVLIISTFAAGVFFLRQTPASTLSVQSSSTDTKISLKNSSFLEEKINALNLFKTINASKLTIVIANQPQRVGVSLSPLNPAVTTKTFSYTILRAREQVTLTLYIDPEVIPPQRKEERERQFTQLALIALYQAAPLSGVDKTPESLEQFLNDYKANPQARTIFDIQ